MRPSSYAHGRMPSFAMPGVGPLVHPSIPTTSVSYGGSSGASSGSTGQLPPPPFSKGGNLPPLFAPDDSSHQPRDLLTSAHLRATRTSTSPLPAVLPPPYAAGGRHAGNNPGGHQPQSLPAIRPGPVAQQRAAQQHSPSQWMQAPGGNTQHHKSGSGQHGSYGTSGVGTAPPGTSNGRSPSSHMRVAAPMTAHSATATAGVAPGGTGGPGNGSSPLPPPGSSATSYGSVMMALSRPHLCMPLTGEPMVARMIEKCIYRSLDLSTTLRTFLVDEVEFLENNFFFFPGTIKKNMSRKAAIPPEPRASSVAAQATPKVEQRGKRVPEGPVPLRPSSAISRRPASANTKKSLAPATAPNTGVVKVLKSTSLRKARGEYKSFASKHGRAPSLRVGSQSTLMLQGILSLLWQARLAEHDEVESQESGGSEGGEGESSGSAGGGAEETMAGAPMDVQQDGAETAADTEMRVAPP